MECAIYAKVKVKMKLLSHVQFSATPWTLAYHAPLSMGFSRKEYCSGLPFPSPEDPPNPGIEPGSPALQVDALLSEPPGKFHHVRGVYNFLGSVLQQQKFEATDGPVLQLGITVLFGKQRKIHPQSVRVDRPKRSVGKREREERRRSSIWLLF